ncbi:MAG: amidohydrolase family protein [Pseudomonadales bacterium]
MSATHRFVNARVIDGLGNDPFNGTVTVRDGLIEGVEREPSAEPLSAHAQTEVVDLGGKTLMPGLIDAHCHVTLDEPHSNDEMFFHRREGLGALIAAHNVQKLIRAGVTSFFDADCLFDLGPDLRDAIEAGLVAGPRMATGGNALLTSVGGTAGALIPEAGRRGYAKVVRSRDEIVAEVRRQVKLGVDWIKVHVTGLIPRQKARGEVQAWSFEELKLVCDTAHEVGIPVVGHCRNAGSIRDAVLAGFDMILHGTFMDEQALEVLIEHQVPVVPTFTFQANLRDFGDRVGADPGLREIFAREIAESAEMLQRAYAAGVPLLCGTESGFSLTPYGEWHHRELQIFVEELGMTPLQAIACGTSACNIAMRLDHEVGAIRPGALADLLVIDGDPIQDITVLGDKRAISQVWLGGVQQSLAPLPERRAVSGWRVSAYSSSKLFQHDAQDRSA